MPDSPFRLLEGARFTVFTRTTQPRALVANPLDRTGPRLQRDGRERNFVRVSFQIDRVDMGTFELLTLKDGLRRTAGKGAIRTAFAGGAETMIFVGQCHDGIPPLVSYSENAIVVPDGNTHREKKCF
jgi:hypothetical protein